MSTARKHHHMSITYMTVHARTHACTRMRAHHHMSASHTPPPPRPSPTQPQPPRACSAGPPAPTLKPAVELHERCDAGAHVPPTVDGEVQDGGTRLKAHNTTHTMCMAVHRANGPTHRPTGRPTVQRNRETDPGADRPADERGHEFTASTAQ